MLIAVEWRVQNEPSLTEARVTPRRGREARKNMDHVKTGAVEEERRGPVKTDAFRGSARHIIKVKSVLHYPKK